MSEHTIKMGGPSGAMRWGYYTAASLRDWSLSNHVLTATIVEKDDTRLSQQPLSFVVVRPSSTWTWPVDTLQITGTSLTAKLGELG